MTTLLQSTNEALLLEHFSSRSVAVSRRTPRCDVHALGFALTDRDIAGLSGAPGGATVIAHFEPEPAVDISTVNDRNKIEEVPPGLYLTVYHPAYIRTCNQVVLYPIETGDGAIAVGVYIKMVDFLPRALSERCFSGIGACMIATIARAARDIPEMLEMRLQAAGGRSWNHRTGGGRWYGYAAWPRYGFDMPVHQLTRDLYGYFKYEPADLAACEMVSEVLASGKSGHEFWKAVGDGWDMSFSLARGSTSLSILSDYLKIEV